MELDPVVTISSQTDRSQSERTDGAVVRRRRFVGGLFSGRHGGLWLFGVVFLAVSFLLRAALHVRVSGEVGANLSSWLRIYSVGLIFDLATWVYIVTPMILIQTFIPDRWYRSRGNRRASQVLFFTILVLIYFDAASEWLFWSEFRARFNFIAVDYLVYTQEVVGNVFQSYPVAAILAGVVIAAGVTFALLRKWYIRMFESESRFSHRMMGGFVFLSVSAILMVFLKNSWSDIGENQYANELSKNGFYSFCAAFRNNRLAYPQFYACEDQGEVFTRLRRQFDGPQSRFVSDEPKDIARAIANFGPEKRCNVVFIVVESLSAEFMGAFGNTKGITPNLDRLSNESLFFTNLYATGTRTTRGLEALILSLPPTPGQSLVKRPKNNGLFSLGTIFSDRGYDLKFIYGGRGFFDNMNTFFSGNHFDVVDQSNFKSEEVTFTTAWGVCDEDLFGRVLKEGDASYSKGRPFFFTVMTTSNHRPYAYPQKIDIPSKKGRNGAVKYCDYAIGELIKAAHEKAWFSNTVFVIVADHCANSAGRVEVPVEDYHIPLLIYAPGIVQAGRVGTLCSQIDVGPTVLGLLGFSYTSQFYGEDILLGGGGRAFIGNYQKIGQYRDGQLCLLEPGRQVKFYTITPDGFQNEAQNGRLELFRDTISVYQSADYLISHHLYSDRSL